MKWLVNAISITFPIILKNKGFNDHKGVDLNNYSSIKYIPH